MNFMKRSLPPLIVLFSVRVLLGAIDVNVYDDTVYSYLDKLNAAGMLQSYMPEQRPLTRYAVAKLVAEAEAYVKIRKESEQLKMMIRELEHEFADARSERNVEFVPLDSFSLSYTATNQAESPVPPNGLGLTSGRVQPLLSYNNGDHFDGYGNVYSYSTHRIRATPYFAAYLQPKYSVRSGEDSTGGINLYRGYVKTGFKDFEVQVGRDDIRWGPGENGLFFSGNARPLDMIKLSNPMPFRFPGFLERFGSFRATAFFSFLGNDYTPSHATLSGYRIDYAPVKWWSIGYDHAVFLWGHGMTPPDFTTGVRSFIGLLASSKYDRADSNHLMGLDSTLRLSHAMGMELYLKVLFEDTNANTGYMLKSDSSWLGGVYFPKIDGMERLSIRSEFIYSGPYSYRHGRYTDGFTLDDKFIGFDSGPDSISGFLGSKYQFNFDEFVAVNIRYLRRSNDIYHFQYDSALENIINTIRDISRPKESNYIIKLYGQKKLSRTTNLFAEVGYDRKSNADFKHANSKDDFSFRIGLTIHRPRP
jgi:hypothetical protein